MICPNCKAPNLIVLESRATLNDTGIRRRRKCENCNHLLTTYELQENDLPKRFFREKGRLYIVKAAARKRRPEGASADLGGFEVEGPPTTGET